MRRLPPPQSSPPFHFTRYPPTDHHLWHLHQPKTKPPTPTPTPLSTTIKQVAPPPAQTQQNTPLPASVLPALFPQTALHNKGRLTPGLGGSHPGASKLTTTKHRRHNTPTSFSQISPAYSAALLPAAPPEQATSSQVLFPQTALLSASVTPALPPLLSASAIPAMTRSSPSKNSTRSHDPTGSTLPDLSTKQRSLAKTMENSPKPVFTQGTRIAELIDSTLNTLTSCAVYGFLCVCRTPFPGALLSTISPSFHYQCTVCNSRRPGLPGTRPGQDRAPGR